ncbi:MAG: hypothetical protein ACKV2V_07205 [Blastocatellia bacterium]
MPTLEQVLKDVQTLPLADQRLLLELIKVPKSLEEIAAEQGLKPFDPEAVRAEAGFWPEEEDIDEFNATVRRWRD